MPLYHPDARVTLGVVLESIREDNRPFAFPVRPQEISIFRNPYIEADTFSVMFNASDLPLTPEVVRAASAEVYLFNKRALFEEPESIAKGEDEQLAIDGQEIKPSIVGIVDDAQMDYDDTGRFITLIGRDYTALYLDEDWDPRFRVQYKGRLDRVIQRLADDVPSSAGIMKVRVELGTGVDRDTAITGFRSVNDFLASQRRGGHSEAFLDANLPFVGRNEGRANRKGLTFPNKANFWEVMLSIAIRYGFIIFVKGTDIILTTPKAYIEGKTGVVTMAWGRNLHDIHMSRKLGKERVPTIECISWDEAKQQVVRGQYPDKADTRKKLVADRVAKKQQSKSRNAKPTKRKPGKNSNALGTVKDEVQQYTIPGITSSAQLRDIARQTYEVKGRAEMTVQLSTSDLFDLDGAPLLDISSGDAMAVKFEPFNSDLTKERIEQQMIERGYDPDVAAKLSAATEEMNQLRQPMRVDDATIDYDTENGITITASIRQFVNLVVQGEKA